MPDSVDFEIHLEIMKIVTTFLVVAEYSAHKKNFR